MSVLEGKVEMLYRYSDQLLELTRVENRVTSKVNVLSIREVQQSLDQPEGEELPNRMIAKTYIRQERQKQLGVCDSNKMNGGFANEKQHNLFWCQSNFN